METHSTTETINDNDTAIAATAPPDELIAYARSHGWEKHEWRVPHDFTYSPDDVCRKTLLKQEQADGEIIEHKETVSLLRVRGVHAPVREHYYVSAPQEMRTEPYPVCYWCVLYDTPDKTPVPAEPSTIPPIGKK